MLKNVIKCFCVLNYFAINTQMTNLMNANTLFDSALRDKSGMFVSRLLLIVFWF